MALTYSNVGKSDSIGRRKITVTDVTFDSSYAKNGESFGGSTLNVAAAKVIGVQPIGGNAAAAGYKFHYVTSTQKLQALKPCPSLIVEESVTVSSDAATLQRIPAYILGIEVTAGSVTGAFRSIPTGQTPTTTQVAVTFTTGAMAFLAADAVTAARVTYIPLGVGPFIEANRVVDEAVTLATAGVNLANRAALIQHVYNSTATGANRLPAIQPVGESPSSNQIAIDIVNSGNTKITPNSAQDTNSAKVTYWKYSALSNYGWTDQADIAVSSNAVVFGEVLDLSGIFIPAFGEVVVGETGASANLQARLIGPSGSVGSNVAVFDPAKNTLSLNSGDSYSTIEMPYIVLDAALFSNAWAEVPNAENLSGVTVRCSVLHT